MFYISIPWRPDATSRHACGADRSGDAARFKFSKPFAICDLRAPPRADLRVFGNEIGFSAARDYFKFPQSFSTSEPGEWCDLSIGSDSSGDVGRRDQVRKGYSGAITGAGRHRIVCTMKEVHIMSDASQHFYNLGISMLLAS